MKFLARLTPLIALATLVGCSSTSSTPPTSTAAQPQSQPQSSVSLSADDLAAKVPAAKPEDVKSIEAVVHAAYESISGPAGPRDWARFRSLFIPQARFTVAGKDKDGKSFVRTWGVEEFISYGGEVFAKEPFYENAIVDQSESYGNMTQVLSSYESRRSPGEKAFQRGINSFQVLYDGKRYWIVSIFWDFERPDNPLPAKFAKK